MTQLGELVKIGAIDSDNSCPFRHYPTTPKNLENKWDNNATKLGTNLAGAAAAGDKLYLPHLESTTVATGSSGKKNYTATYNPHHLLPGEASWPHTKLKRWMDEPTGDVNANVGYDVNCYQNGLDLPSNNEMRGNWKLDAGRTEDFQARYAFAAMDAAGRTRQFHDSHKAYNDFAIQVMDKISAKLDSKELAGNMGCGHKNCVAEKATKKYPVPAGLLARVNTSSSRLAAYLFGSPRNWRKPIMTSKFSLMYKNRSLTHETATEALETKNFVY